MLRGVVNSSFGRLGSASRCTRHSLVRCGAFAGVVVAVLGGAVFSYAAFYYWYVPELLHVRQLNFLFDTDCDRTNGDFCNYPSDNLTLIPRKSEELLTAGQQYVFLLDLEMPESPTNQKLGLFISTIQLYTAGGEVLVTSSRASMLAYKSRLYLFVETLFFCYPMLFGFTREKQTVTVRLLNDYIENVYKPTMGVHLILKVKQIEIYRATLRIHAEFAGLRYLMFYWPVVSAICGIPMYASFLSIFTFIAWYAKSSPSSENEIECEIKRPAMEDFVSSSNVGEVSSNVSDQHEAG